MRKLRYFSVLAAIAAFSFTFSACGDDPIDSSDDLENTDPNDPNNPGGSGNEGGSDDPWDPENIYSSPADFIKNLEPGMYEWAYTENGETDVTVFAKSKDGWYMEIQYANSNSPVVRIFDPETTFWKFTNGDQTVEKYEYKAREDMMGIKLTYGHMHEIGPECAGSYVNAKKYAGILDTSNLVLKKVAESFSGYKDAYNAMKGKYLDAATPFFEDMQPNVYQSFDKGWRSDLYPNDMDVQKYVFPWTAKGDIHMKVTRDNEWPENVSVIYPCIINHVCRIEANIYNFDMNDARALIAKIKAEGHYVRILSDIDYNIEGLDLVSFQADHWYEDEDPYLGINYFTPGYEVGYDAINGCLVIKYEVSFLRWV